MSQSNKPAQSTKEPTRKLSLAQVVVYVTYGVVVFAEIVLLFRIFLLLFNANPNTPFVQFIYNTSSDFLAPFRGIFPPHITQSGGYLDVTAIFALVVYLIIAVLVQSLMNYLEERNQS